MSPRCSLRVLAAAWLALLVAACSSPLPERDAASAGREEVLAGVPFVGAGPLPRLPEDEVLGLDGAMRDFLAEAVDARSAAPLRLHQLAYALISPSSFGLQYTDDTRTASATFHGRNGNCLSFTNLFVALARSAGLDARFQQVDIPPDWEQRGDTFVLNRHINVLVDLGRGGRKVVDFNIEDYRSGYDLRPIPDRRAFAHYYSNVGVEHLQAGRRREAFLYLRKGLEIDAEFAPLWANLGALYSRAGELALAEAAYSEALRFEGAELVAISNLARLHERRGDTARAAAYRERARAHRERNPYYRFHLAREAFLAKEPAAALPHLDFAVRRKPQEDEFLFLRGIVRLQLGDTRGARADIERAEAVAGDDALRRNYHSKLELLLGDSPTPP